MARAIYKGAGWAPDRGSPYPHYVAFIEEAGPDLAVGVWFPDLADCVSTGGDTDEALRNAPEALQFYAAGVARGRWLSSSLVRTLTRPNSSKIFSATIAREQARSYLCHPAAQFPLPQR